MNFSSFLITGPPKIDKDHVHRDKIWCRAGKSLKLEDVEIEGEPPAKVTWSFKDVKQDKWSWKNIKISQGSGEDPEYYTTIVIGKSILVQNFNTRWRTTESLLNPDLEDFLNLGMLPLRGTIRV